MRPAELEPEQAATGKIDLTRTARSRDAGAPRRKKTRRGQTRRAGDPRIATPQKRSEVPGTNAGEINLVWRPPGFAYRTVPASTGGGRENLVAIGGTRRLPPEELVRRRS